MKIQSSIGTPRVGGTESGKRPASRVERAGEDPAARVSLSADASWVASVRAEAGALPEVREDVVANVRAAVENGTFDASVDMDSVVDGLLADL